MITANNQVVMSDVFTIITELKRQLEVNGIHRFYKTIKTPNNVMVCCPFHKNGQERKPSCGIVTVQKKDHVTVLLVVGLVRYKK